MRRISSADCAVVRSEEAELLRHVGRPPFAAYRWSRSTGSTRGGHPTAGAAHYGVIATEHIMYVAPMIRLPSAAADAADPVFLLDTDMWDL